MKTSERIILWVLDDRDRKKIKNVSHKNSSSKHPKVNDKEKGPHKTKKKSKN